MPLISVPKFAYCVLVRGIRTIPLLNYIDYNKTDAMELIQREIGWRPYGAKHFESVFTRFFQGYVLPRKFGYDKRRAHFSCLIVAGEMTRDDALAKLEQDPLRRTRSTSRLGFRTKKVRPDTRKVRRDYGGRDKEPL